MVRLHPSVFFSDIPWPDLRDVRSPILPFRADHEREVGEDGCRAVSMDIFGLDGKPAASRFKKMP